MREDWRQYVVAEARTWKGTPYQHKGRVKGVGVDCGGIIYQTFSPLLPLKPFPRDYPQDWAMHKGANELYLDFIADYIVEVPSARAAGIALFQYGRNFSHGAICTERGTFIHAYGKNGFGCVREDSRSFFNDNGGKPRAVKFFDLDPKWQ